MTLPGRLTIYSAAERRYCEPLLRGFSERHPDIGIDFVFGISTELHRRFLEETAGGAATADLFWSSAMDQQLALVLDGHARPHGVVHALPAGADYRGLAVATTCEPLFTLSRDGQANAGSAGEVAALIEADPSRLAGRVVVPDIETNGLGFLAMAWWALTDPQFDRLCRALEAAAPRTAGSAPALIAAVSEGAAFALHLLGAYAKRAVAADPALALAPSATPSMAVARVAFVPRGAANPEAGSAFLAYMLSPEGQAAIGEAGLFPILGGQERAVAAIPLDDRFTRLLDPSFRASVLSRWRRAVGRNEDLNRRKTA